jgi:hypothetical protein
MCSQPWDLAVKGDGTFVGQFRQTSLHHVALVIAQEGSASAQLPCTSLCKVLCIASVLGAVL